MLYHLFRGHLWREDSDCVDAGAAPPCVCRVDTDGICSSSDGAPVVGITQGWLSVKRRKAIKREARHTNSKSLPFSYS